MNVLAFDTSTDACTIALRCGDDVLIDHRVEPRTQAQTLLPGIERLLVDAGLTPRQLDALVYGQGPGSFTGVRIAVAAAQGLAFAADIGVLGVSTLAAIAEGCRRECADSHVIAMLDARMDELYVGEYRSTDDGPMLSVRDEGVMSAREAQLDAIEETAVFAGSGVATLDPTLLAGRTGRPDRLPHAIDLLALADARLATGEFDAPANAQPVYLRERVALTEAERGVKGVPP